jgi:hypothetical protein
MVTFPEKEPPVDGRSFEERGPAKPSEKTPCEPSTATTFEECEPVNSEVLNPTKEAVAIEKTINRDTVNFIFIESRHLLVYINITFQFRFDLKLLKLFGSKTLFYQLKNIHILPWNSRFVVSNINYDDYLL